MIKLNENLKKCCENFIAWNSEYKSYWALSNTIRFSTDAENEIPFVLETWRVEKASKTIDTIKSLKNKTIKIALFEEIIGNDVNFNLFFDNHYHQTTIIDNSVFVFKFKMNEDKIKIIDVLRDLF